MSLRVLLVGNGGREHALAWKLAQSPLVSDIYCVPGNGGTAGVNKTTNHPEIKADDFAGLLKFAVDQKVNLLVPGPEQPLVDGIADYFEENGPARIKCFGPSKAAAQMEGSKAFSKDFMKRHNIPTAAYENFSDHAVAKAYLEANKNTKFVIKASGIAAGKGVIIPETHEEAVAALSSIMLDREFGSAGDSVVIEEFLEGDELSVLTFSDGSTTLSLPAAQDHKRALDGDKGLNTGGMGCYAPTPVGTAEIMARIQRESIQPTIDGMRKEDFPMVGCLFTGFMLTPSGPKVLEYNVRFGDPETQTLLPLLESDLAEIMLRCARGSLDGISLKLRNAFSTTVVIAAGGYPGSYAKGTPMTVTNPTTDDSFIFHAGTSLSSSGQLVTAGGRVIAATAIASTIPEAVTRAYAGVEAIKFDNMHFRRDIAHRALKQLSTSQSNGLTYASTGVSIEAGNTLVQRIKPALLRTARPGCNAIIGGFGGDIALPAAGYPASAPTVLAAIDGIGTKLMLARHTGIYNTVGIDLVAMNANDLVVQGGEPLAFLDYYACSALDVAAAAAFVEGVCEGCVRAGCALVGGETAEMPGVYQGEGDWDAAGCAIGALAQGRTMLPAKDAMVAGDVLIALGSSGCHSNGFSLVRKIIERAGLRYTDPAPWEAKTGRTVGQALLEPTKMYVKPLLPVFDESHKQEKLLVKGLAHITGGGLTENIPRMLPKHLAARMQVDSWPVPPVLSWLKKAGGVESKEFAKAFNTGLGMVGVVPKEEADVVEKMLKDAGETVYRVGELVDKTDGAEGVDLVGIERWN
ncbi:hypothetical protein FH972_024907 [Carpinus fangiana]|uniref:ATP-grasp domain-containing protein n=1 Tax=Carpinus fangiana TaxID=176857 RepID=A0A5N6KZR0_9ROSI|nr:hypothetical protein FH972_024907 [Carpinus fangiana]